MSERLNFEYPASWVESGLKTRAEQVRLQACEQLGLTDPWPRIRWFGHHGDPTDWPHGEVFRTDRRLAGVFMAGLDPEAVFVSVDFSPDEVLFTLRHELQHLLDHRLFHGITELTYAQLEERADAFAAATTE